MINTAKYFVLLEQLRFEETAPNKTSSDEPAELLQHNLTILEKYIKCDVQQQLEELCKALQLPAVQAEAIKIGKDDLAANYIVRMEFALHTLTSSINFDSDAKEDLISVAHLKLCIQAVQQLAFHALRCQLNEELYKSPVFIEAKGSMLNRPLLLLSVQFIRSLLPIRQLHIANSMALVLRDLLAAIMSLKLESNSEEQLDSTLAQLWQHESRPDYLRHLLLLKATPNLSKELAQLLHRQLLVKLSSEQGFASLVATLQTSRNAAEIVANIVAQRGYSAAVQRQLIHQAFDFCRFALYDANLSLAAGVLSLRRLYDLNADNRSSIATTLVTHWQPLTAPEDLLSGLILMEQAELAARIALWQQLFCSSSVACLPSALLVDFMPLLLRLYAALPVSLEARGQLAMVITRCLDNREEKEELPRLLHQLLSSELPSQWQGLHPRVLLVPELEQIVIKVASLAAQAEQPMCHILPQLLLASDHHALTYKIFMALLRFMAEQQATPPTLPLINSETELINFLHSKYQLRLELLIALNTLIAHEPLKTQLAGHSKEFMMLLRELLQQRLKAVASASSEETDQLLLLILTLLQELLERGPELLESTRELRLELQQLAKQSSHQLIQQRVETLLLCLNGAWSASTARQDQPFNKARSLIEQRESHVQVAGIQMLLELLRRRDAATMSQGHLIIALALNTLKESRESYTFLNCVRLFVELLNVMEAELLDKLSDEYLDDSAALDYRLIVGEALLKAAQQMGPLLYKYKAELLNCFMAGSRSSLDEFRMSAFANLAQLCRLLAYQLHSCFQELLQLINSELSFGQYLPAKRGAVLVLAELLAGMDNLLDFEEQLLPIYRLLKAIESSESCDEQMRRHAANGLRTLNEKCKELLKPPTMVQQLEKQIKVLGIKDEPKRRSKHILELN